jgi:hypothetical protein
VLLGGQQLASLRAVGEVDLNAGHHLICDTDGIPLTVSLNGSCPPTAARLRLLLPLAAGRITPRIACRDAPHNSRLGSSTGSSSEACPCCTFSKGCEGDIRLDL